MSKSDFSSGCRALRTYFLPFDQPKMRFGWSRKSDDSSCRMALQVIFCFLSNRICDFFKLIKRRFTSSNGTHFLPLDKRNSTLVRSRKRCFKCSPGTGNSFSSSRPAQNATWVKLRKRCLKCSHVTLNSLSASWPSRNANWLSSRNRCLMSSHGSFNLFSSSGPA